MLRKVSCTFTHESGPRCIVTMEERPGAVVSVCYSLRDKAGIPVHVAASMLEQWRVWGSNLSEALKTDSNPPLPLGWR